MPRKVRVVTAKLNVEPSLFANGQSPYVILRELFQRKFTEPYEKGDDNKKIAWVIVDNQVVSKNGIDYAVGKLGRIGPKSFSQYKREIHRFDEYQIKDLVFATSHFVLRIDKERLAFNEARYISMQQFIEAFSEILARAESRLGTVSIFPDISPQEFTAEFNKLKVIERVRLEFVAPNAMSGFTDAAELLRSKLINETGAGRAIVECESRKKEGLRFQNDVIKAAATIPVLTPQYGSVVIHGFADENRTVPILLRSLDKVKYSVLEIPRADDSQAIWERYMRLLSGNA